MFRKFYLKHKFKIISVIVFVIIFILMTNFADNRKNTNGRIISKTEIELNNSLKNECRKANDSIQRIKEWKIARLKGFGNSLTTLFFGVKEIEECDTCNTFPPENNRTKKFFIELPGYTLKEDASFFINKDKYYIQYTVTDKIYPDGSSWGYYEEKQVPVRYSIADEKGALLIPVSQRTHYIFHIIVAILTIAFMFFFLFTTIFLPFNTLVRIAGGKPFTKSNIKNLYITGWTLLIGAFSASFIPLVIEFFLRHKIPKEIYFPFLLSLTDNRASLIAGVVVLLLANAFKRGYKLQQEQDLTI